MSSLLLKKDRLYRRGASAKQLALFEELFGDSVIVSEEICLEHAERIDWNAVAWCLLSCKEQTVYYNKGFQIMEYYEIETKPLYQTYHEEKYDCELTARSKLNEARRLILKEVVRKKAVAFARCYISQCNGKKR